MKKQRANQWTILLLIGSFFMPRLFAAKSRVILEENFEDFPSYNQWTVQDLGMSSAKWGSVQLGEFGSVASLNGSAGYCAGKWFLGDDSTPTVPSGTVASMANTINLGLYEGAILTFSYNIPSITPGFDILKI